MCKVTSRCKIHSFKQSLPTPLWPRCGNVRIKKDIHHLAMTKWYRRIIPKYLYKQAQTAGKPSDPVARCRVPKNFPRTREGFGRGGCRWYVLFLSFVCLLYYSLWPAILLVPPPLPWRPLIAHFMPPVPPTMPLVPTSMPPVPPSLPLLPLPIVYHPLCLTNCGLGPVISWGLPSQTPSVTISGSFETCFSPS